MSLYGRVFEEKAIFAIGEGRNGKSTFFNALSGVLGTYSDGIDIQTLTTDRANKGASLATLRGKRLIITGELEQGARLSVSTLKRICSTDAVVAEEKYRMPFTFTPSHTLVMFSNYLPRIGSTDSGTWRRICVVPFNAVIPANKSIQNFADVLVEQAGPAILQWAVEGAVNFVSNFFRLTIPDCVAEVTEQYKEREDWLSNFISERCICEPNARVGASELYAEYREWAGNAGDYVRRLNDFNSAMEAAGYEKRAPKNRKTWYGLRINLGEKFGNAWAATV